jgi:hypothetical protein
VSDAEQVRDAWRRFVPGVTAEEVAALLPIVRDGASRVRGLVLAYRAGRRAATPLPAPLAGFAPCPNCLSVDVAALLFEPGGTLLAKCVNCSGYFVAATGEPSDSHYVPAAPDDTATDGDGVVGTPDRAGPS